MIGVIIITTIISITILIIVIIIVGEQLKVSGAHARTVGIWDGFHVIRMRLESDDCKPLTQS